MKQRQLGQTELSISPLGLGTVKFGRNQGVKYPHAFELPRDKDIQQLLSICRDNAVNLIDTAPAYGSSEERLGKLLKGQRHEWVVCTKAGENFENGCSQFDFSATGICQSVHTSLKRLKTDYLDVVLIHSDGDDETIIKKYGVFETLASLQKQGHIRYYGMSTKTVAGGLLTLAHSDIAMVTYNPVSQEEQPVLDYAQENNKGIFIKKALASGHLDKLAKKNPVQHAMEFIFQHSAVSSVITGTLNPQHLMDNITCIDNIL